jgi:hypothetical protein
VSPRKLAAVTLLALAMASVAAQAEDKSPAVQEFNKRIQDYLKMRQSAVKQVPSLKPTKTSTDIGESQKAMAEAIATARQEAQQGDIFTPEITALIRQVMAATMASPEGTKIRKSLRHSEPVTLTLHVNDAYPAKVPLQSTPPTLLMNLPKLPKELDYRLIGRSLALRDCDANIIVDFIPNALPVPPARPVGAR